MPKETDTELVLNTVGTGAVTIKKSDLTDRRKGFSAMPDGLAELVTPRELRGLKRGAIPPAVIKAAGARVDFLSQEDVILHAGEGAGRGAVGRNLHDLTIVTVARETGAPPGLARSDFPVMAGVYAMTANEILEELRPLGRDSYKRVLFNHGVKEPCYGVRIGDMKRFQRRIKKDYQLALELYDTGNYDAMYLAGLIADDARMTKLDLRRWVGKAYCRGLCGATVPWVAAGSAHGWELGLEWIDAPRELVVAAGWGTLACLVSIKEDAELDLAALKRLLQRVQKCIHQAPDGVRYSMNLFVIAVGSYVKPLTQAALATGEKIGPVSVDLGNTACQVPFSPDHIRKVEQHGSLGKKRRTAKC